MSAWDVISTQARAGSSANERNNVPTVCTSRIRSLFAENIQQGIRRTKKSFKEEHEFRRARSSLKRRWGSKEERSQRIGLNLYLSQMKYLFRGDCPSLIGAVLEKDRFRNAIFGKLVSFIGNIEDLSALDAPRIDSVNWKRFASNNNCFFVSGRLPIILGSHKQKKTTRRAPTDPTCFFLSLKKMRWTAHQPRSANK